MRSGAPAERSILEGARDPLQARPSRMAEWEDQDEKPVGATSADTACTAVVPRGGMHEHKPRRMRSGGVFGSGRDQRSRGSHRARCEVPSSIGVSSLTRRARTQLGPNSGAAILRFR